MHQRAWFIVLVAVVGLAVISSVVSSRSESSEATSGDLDPALGSVADELEQAVPEQTGADRTEADQPRAGIGQPADDGDFRFVVAGVECGATTIGGQYFNTTAQGQFCIVDMTVTNIGDEAQSFFGENTVLLNDQGQEFSADSAAALYLEDSSSLYEEINPGNSLQGRVVFDVPPGMVPAAIELHDSMFSGCVTVSLR